MKPIVYISKCLGFESCRWNGMMLHSDLVEMLKQHVEFIPICPEVGIGLGVPRDPIRIIKSGPDLKLIQPSTGLDITEKMNSFTSNFLDKIDILDGFILKESSPSCGFKNVKHFAAMESKVPLETGGGLFGLKVITKFPNIAIEDEGRLRNFSIRETFLTRIFTYASFREVYSKMKFSSLVDFHSKNKLLFLAYNEVSMRKLGKIVANSQNLPVEKVFLHYFNEMANTIDKQPKAGAAVNVFMHAFGYFSDKLTPSEKSHFLTQLERYKKGSLPLSAVTLLTMAYILRFNIPYLKEQTFFSPYPDNLISITDSGKGKDFSR
jgi:uncharacterized protein YbgA (DUF1722 family)/uncharacterized protein YbbK (DUF523 family)